MIAKSELKRRAARVFGFPWRVSQHVETQRVAGAQGPGLGYRKYSLIPKGPQKQSKSHHFVMRHGAGLIKLIRFPSRI